MLPQAQSYHKLDYNFAHAELLRPRRSSEGRMAGAGSPSRWGVSGEVSALEFSRLTEGQHPVTGAQMVRHRISTEYTNPDGSTTKAVAHRAGWGCDVCTPRSPSH